MPERYSLEQDEADMLNDDLFMSLLSSSDRCLNRIAVLNSGDSPNGTDNVAEYFTTMMKDPIMGPLMTALIARCILFTLARLEEVKC